MTIIVVVQEVASSDIDVGDLLRDNNEIE